MLDKMSRLWSISIIWAITLAITHGQTSLKGDAAANYTLTESEYLTLEGGSMLPYPEEVSKVERDVSLIRGKFSEIRDIKHNRKWIPGQVLTTRITGEQLAQVNSSEYGPLKYIEKIDVMPFFYVTVLTFDKPYSPPMLAAKLESQFGFPCTPNTVYYEYEVDNITYRMSNSTYVFKQGTGVCKDDCRDRYLWEFTVDEGGNATLEQEWVVPQDGQRVIIY